MKAGTYYVGDLCYVFERMEWNDLLDITDFGDGEFEFKDGTPFCDLFNCIR